MNAVDASREAPAKGRILLVDDEEAVRRVTARLLQHVGYEVETAQDGQEAVEMLQADPTRCDVVVLDGSMPRMTGRDAARRIRDLRADLPLVLATGFIDDESEDMLATHVFDDVIAKPYDIASLARVIAAHVPR